VDSSIACQTVDAPETDHCVTSPAAEGVRVVTVSSFVHDEIEPGDVSASTIIVACGLSTITLSVSDEFEKPLVSPLYETIVSP
jgi:hypothetical protein